MGDSAEGLIDAEAKIRERMEEMEMERAQLRKRKVRNPEQLRQVESLKLARKEMDRQLALTVHETRRVQIMQAVEELDRRILAVQSSISVN